MIIQRNQPIKVWGTHLKNKEIVIAFNKQSYKTKANFNGDWELSLPEMKAGGPFEMTISSDQETIEIEDIFIGDVWICSGQSNMEWMLYNTYGAQEAIAQASDHQIRHFKVPTSFALSPEKTLAGGKWEVASPESVGFFTAVGYYFAENLRESYPDVPIGLLNTSWGGSRIEPWMSAKALDIIHPETYIASIEARQDRALQKLVNRLKETFPYLTEEDAGTVQGAPLWATTNLDENDWVTIQVPDLWEGQGYEGFDGIGWYRTSFELTEEQSNATIWVNLGMIDDSDTVWVNGVEVGATEQRYNLHRNYSVASSVLEPGKNTLVVRVEDTGGGGGIYGSKDSLFIKTSNNRIALAKPWKFKIGSYRKSTNEMNQISMVLYNKMIFPLLNFPIKGAIWYQGEANANSEADATAYATLFSSMITQWREDWNVGDFPFLWVQLANFMQPQEPSVPSNWAILRESQSKALSLPSTAEAIIIDIGEAEDIHPKNKKDVGYRLALGAKKIAFQEGIIYSGPSFKSREIRDGKIVIRYEHLGSGFAIRGDETAVKGFSIAGADKHFVWAEARIEDNEIVVWSPEITRPMYVRYAWGDNPANANLYNKEGLPAKPFRTD